MSASDTMMFLAVCDLGSFQAAADALGVANTTVGRRVQRLETALGVKLLLRSTRGLEVTEAGRVLAKVATPARTQLARAEDQVRSLMLHPAGRLRIAAPEGMMGAFVSEVVLDYMDRFPDVSVEVISSLSHPVPDGEHLHMAIWASRGEAPDDLIQRTLGPLDMRIVCRPDHLAAHPITSADDLARANCIVLGGSPDARLIELDTPDGPRTLTLPVGLYTSSVDLTLNAVLAGRGPAIVPWYSCHRLVRAGQLVEVLPDHRLRPNEIRLFYRSSRPPLRVRAMADSLVDWFERNVRPDGTKVDR